MWFVYLIINCVNDKLYVGKTSNVHDRWVHHQRIARGGRERHPKQFHYLHRAISKYGPENFSVIILSSFEIEEEAFAHEQQCVLLLLGGGHQLYNLTSGGEGSSGFRHSEESKRKISQSLLGKNKGRKMTKPVSDETRKKMSLAAMGNKSACGRGGK